ncbi:MAG: hypothetical protein KDI60_16890, partial [Xanthomonadales bacterium]|nr:hypothetical protein [Xanthomonadales bacterium]
ATRRVDTSIASPLQVKLNKLAAADNNVGATTVNQPTGPMRPQDSEGATAVSKPMSGAAAEKPAAAQAKPKPVMLYAAVGALVVVVVAGVAMWPKPQSDLPKVILDAQQQIEVQDKLLAARAMLRNENAEGAADLYFKVLKDFDCTNEEARGGLKGSDPSRYDDAISGCK